MNLLLEFLKVRTRISDADITALRQALDKEYYRRMDAEKHTEEMTG